MTKTELILRDMFSPGKAAFIVGGQWGSEAKGCAAAWLAYELAKQGKQYDIVTCNSGAQAGHTSTHKGKKRIVFHLPTVPLITEDEIGWKGVTFLNAGSVIDPEGLKEELKAGFPGDILIHPMAAVITDECREAERNNESAQTKIASTRKGVGEAISRKVLRSGMVAKDHPFLKEFCHTFGVNYWLSTGMKVLVEVPQGVSLSLNHSGFYPYCTSRDCTPALAMSDAGIHPSYYGATMVVLRTYPIRVGNIVEEGKELGQSGSHYGDQREVSWEELQVEAEITTVTKRIRRVFTFSEQQIVNTFDLCRPDVVFLTFCNYAKEKAYLDEIDSAIHRASKVLCMPPPRVIYQHGPTTDDIGEEL